MATQPPTIGAPPPSYGPPGGVPPAPPPPPTFSAPPGSVPPSSVPPPQGGKKFNWWMACLVILLLSCCCCGGCSWWAVASGAKWMDEVAKGLGPEFEQAFGEITRELEKGMNESGSGSSWDDSASDSWGDSSADSSGDSTSGTSWDTSDSDGATSSALEGLAGAMDDFSKLGTWMYERQSAGDTVDQESGFKSSTNTVTITYVVTAGTGSITRYEFEITGDGIPVPINDDAKRLARELKLSRAGQ